MHDLDLVVKQFSPLQGIHEPVYAMAHHQDFLYNRELRNLDLIRMVISQGKNKNFGRKVVPYVQGFLNREHMVVMNYLGGLNRKEQLLKAKKVEDLSYFFLDGVKYVARFDGLCNAFENNFNKSYDYGKDKDLFLSATKGLFKENLVRSVYNNLESNHEGSIYDYDAICGYIQKTMGVNLEERLRELFSLESQLKRNSKLQHRDCNGLNMIGERLIDLEDFGYSSWTDDISSYCIIVGKGNNVIFKDKDFSYFLQAYLSLEQAYELQDWERAKDLMKASNGQFRQRVGEIMSKQDYADFILSFFVDAIAKNVQLGATFSRYTREMAQGFSANTQDSVKELFENISLLDQWFSASSNPKQGREYFYAVGNLLNDLKISAIDESILNRIKSENYGTIADNLDRNSPDFKS
ncbi:hypothetical protein HYX11_01100 [Candidatus Woesearchaeota archaeon]|nr:hypothetical protein [Candidatus Woesearchaeota archaeon]